MLFNIFQLLESMGITDNLLCLISAKWLNSFDFLMSSRVIGDDNLSLNLTVTATKRPDLSVLSKICFFDYLYNSNNFFSNI